MSHKLVIRVLLLCVAFVPVAHHFLATAMHAQPTVPTGPRLRVPAPDVEQPLPLPILARPAHTRVPLDDPTAEFSIAAALAPPPPLRTQPAQFVRWNLPDPFEHRR